ncbi:DUF3991 and toprim domain-containing protein [Bacillus pseudomycoides]|nr:DUF3991 and toprim domain-containing protein [Bacillus pseudomycoides]PFX55026.1 hypothetical protein COL31_10730 [Bacillus pseudomycoides]PFZ83125.1 hypothetical protein COL69_11910 [Bacillus pseudomycoides]PGE12014.1 hypothetical protein COM51_24150 [Bacillus pseudomycoides]
MTYRLAEEEVMKAKDVDLLSYLEAKGEKFQKEGNYYRHTEHDSLIIRDNMFAWNSRGEKGYGAISFAKMYYGMSFQEAVRDVNLGDYPTFTSSKEEEPKQDEPFRYPGHLEVQDKQAIKQYLTQERKIDSRLVNWLIGQDLVAQDKKKNVVFKWREQGGTGDIVGAERQGTVKMENKRGSFKQILPNGKPHTGFMVDVGKPTSIYYFESPIDLLSYWTLQQNRLQNARLVSMNGLKMKTVLRTFKEAKDEGLLVNRIVLAVDNDKAGKEFTEKMGALTITPRVQMHIPSQEKDWNDVLKAVIQSTEKQQQPHMQPQGQQKKRMVPIQKKEMEHSV